MSIAPVPPSPEKRLNQDLQREEHNIHGNLFLLNNLFNICSDSSLSAADIDQKAQSILKEIKQTNPLIVRDLKIILGENNPQKLQEFFEQEKQKLSQVLIDEMACHKQVNKEINTEKIEHFPTDS